MFHSQLSNNGETKMIYYNEDTLSVRSMMKSDIEKFVNGFAEPDLKILNKDDYTIKKIINRGDE